MLREPVWCEHYYTGCSLNFLKQYDNNEKLNVQSQAGGGSEQSNLVGGVPAHDWGEEVGTR